MMSKILFLLFVFICGLRMNAASLMLQFSDEELTLASENIVTGTVLKKESYFDSSKKLIFTRVTIQKEDNLKGIDDSQVVEVVVPGGAANGYILKVEDVPEFTEGERVLLFLRKNKLGYITPIGLFQGKLTLSSGLDGRLTKQSQKKVMNVKAIIKQQNQK
jgi:hypothetical protein